MPSTIRPITTIPDWLELKRDYVGCSEHPALLGIHPWLSALGLHVKKRDRVVDEDTPSMRRGRKVQKLAFEIASEEFPTWRITDPQSTYADDDLRWIATPDALVEAPEHGLGVLEIKNVHPQEFGKHWRNEHGDVRVPDHVVSQINGQMELTGANWGAAAALVIDRGIDLHVIDVPKDAVLIQNIRDAVALFWDRIARGILPEIDHSRDAALLAKIFRKDDGSEVDLTGDNELPEVLDRHERAQAAKKFAESEIEVCKAVILDRLRQAQKGHFNGGYVSAKTINRKAYSVPEGSYRQIRVVRKREQAA